jgi:hypothetical protein
LLVGVGILSLRCVRLKDFGRAAWICQLLSSYKSKKIFATIHHHITMLVRRGRVSLNRLALLLGTVTVLVSHNKVKIQHQWPIFQKSFTNPSLLRSLLLQGPKQLSISIIPDILFFMASSRTHDDMLGLQKDVVSSPVQKRKRVEIVDLTEVSPLSAEQ